MFLLLYHHYDIDLINGCNLIITQLIIPKLHFYFGFQLFPILYGFHVLLGSFLFFIILFYIMFSSDYPFYLMEFSFSLFLSSHY